jgi:hypothetical protein
VIVALRVASTGVVLAVALGTAAAKGIGHLF